MAGPDGGASMEAHDGSCSMAGLDGRGRRSGSMEGRDDMARRQGLAGSSSVSSLLRLFVCRSALLETSRAWIYSTTFRGHVDGERRGLDSN